MIIIARKSYPKLCNILRISLTNNLINLLISDILLKIYWIKNA